jgi:hypothetical protein
MYDWKTFRFGRGSHPKREDGMCVMEAVAYLAGEVHSDSPLCASWTIRKLAICVNDAASDELRNELLRDLPWRIVGTRSPGKIEQQRRYMAVDWAIRVALPLLLRRAGIDQEAQQLEQLPMLQCGASLRPAYAPLGTAEKKMAGKDELCRAVSAGCSAMVYATHDCAVEHVVAIVRLLQTVANKAALLSPSISGSDYYKLAVEISEQANDDLDKVLRSCAQLLDRLIRVTEPQEKCIKEELCGGKLSG